MNRKERRKFYEKIYLREMDEWKRIDTRLRLALTVFALLSSGGVFLAERILRLIVNFDAILNIMSLLVIALNIVIFVYLCYCMYRSLAGYQYHKILLPEVSGYYGKMRQHYGKYRSKYGKQRVEAMIEKALERKVIEWLEEGTGYNESINQRRSTYVTRCFAVLPLYLFALALLYILFYIR